MYSALSHLLPILEASVSISQAVFGMNAIARTQDIMLKAGKYKAH